MSLDVLVRALEGNPYHEPAGSPTGGEFAHAPGGDTGGYMLDAEYSGDRVYRYTRELDDGFIEYVDVAEYKGLAEGDNRYFIVETNAYGGRDPVNVFAKNPFNWRSKDREEQGLIKAKDHADALRQYREKAKSMQGKLDNYLQKETDKAVNARNGSSMYKALYDYRRDANKKTAENLIWEIEGKRTGWAQSRRTLDKLQFDTDGTITLYRGGRQNGMSWTTSKSEAERFARYGFGNVPVSVSGFIGIQAIKAGKPASVEIHTQKWKRNDLLAAVGDSEMEVLVRPRAIKARFSVSAKESYIGFRGEGESVQEAAPPRNPHTRTGKIDLVGSVHLALSVDTVGRKERADLLYQQARSLYDNALTEAISEVGCSGPGHLSGGAELSALKKRAEWSAASIAKTYNKDLLTMVEAAEQDWIDGHKGSKKGMTRLWLAKAIAPAIKERDAWKETQIGVTEQTWVNDKATQDFLARNQVEGEIRVVPESAVCPICKALVARGWMKISESKSIFLPAHISCPHSWETKPLKESVPDCASLWRGQVRTGRKGEGTEALIDALMERVTEDHTLEYNPFHDAQGRFTSGGGVGSRVNFNDPRAVAVAKGEGKGVLLSRRGDTREYRELGKHLSVISGETDEWGKSLFSDWKAGLTGDEFMSIVRYTESDYRPVNAQLRGRLKGLQWKSDRLPPAEFRKVRDNLDSALQKSIIPENIIVYRGGGSFSLREAVQMGKIKEGGVFKDKGFVSTSITSKAAFYKPVEIKIRISAGTHGAFVGWNGFTAFRNEAELILPRNQRFFVRKIEKHTQGVRLELDLL